MLKPVLGSQIQLGHSLANGLVGCWLLNEGSGDNIVDLSGNGSVGTLLGTSPAWSSGKNGHAIALQGGSSNDRINIGAVTPLQLTGTAITVYARIMLTAVGTSFGMLVSATNSAKYELRLNSTTDKPEFFINNTNVTAIDALIINTWYDVVGTYDGATVNIYINGILIDANPKTGAIDGAGADITIGSRSTSFEIAAIFDFVYIYSRALSAQEIAELYREPFQMFRRRSIELWSPAVQGGAFTGLEIYVYDTE